MAIKTLQITLTGAAQQVSAKPIKCKWEVFQNNGTPAVRAGDANVSATLGYSIAPAAAFPLPVPFASTFGTDLSQWFVIGTAAQLLDIVYDDLNF